MSFTNEKTQTLQFLQELQLRAKDQQIQRVPIDFATPVTNVEFSTNAALVETQTRSNPISLENTTLMFIQAINLYLN